MMGKGGSRTVQTTAPDAASQGYIDRMRRAATGAAGVATGGGPYFTGPQTQSIQDQVSPFMNPYISNVVDATRGEFDFLRNQASVDANQQATQAGAFGGSRHGVAEGTRLGALDRAQTSQIADLLSGGYNNALSMGTDYAERQRQLREQQMQEPLWRQNQALQFYNMGMGPVGQSVSQPKGSALGSAAGGAMAGSAFGPWGTAIGGGLGLLGGIFG